MTSAERAAREAIVERFITHVDTAAAQPFTLEEAEALGVRAGLHPAEAEALALEVVRALMEVYLGKAWGVGPEASWWDRLRARWNIWRDRV